VFKNTSVLLTCPLSSFHSWHLKLRRFSVSPLSLSITQLSEPKKINFKLQNPGSFLARWQNYENQILASVPPKGINTLM
jgi:hypothetical protein